MTAYYNDNDPFCVEWLRELIKAGLIAPGEVDERSIEEVKPDDLRGFTQCHFFAGIGVWSYALRNAGWDDTREVWTGSCPCQPFSAAGQRKGFNDERHLWPHWYRLIRSCRPSVVFGEQVSTGLGSRDSSSSVRALWEQKAYLGLCENWLRWSNTQYLQDVSQQTGSLATPGQAGPDLVSSQTLSGGRESKSSGEGNTVRPNGRMASGETGPRSLRGDGDSIQSVNETGVGYPVAGSNTSGQGLHDEQHKSGPLCGQRGVRGLGREQNGSGSVGDHHEAQKKIGRVIECVDGEIEAKGGSSWVNLIQTDLEATGYTFGALVLGAHSIGAPHIRQRLYFVADTEINRASTLSEKRQPNAEWSSIAGERSDANPRRPQERRTSGALPYRDRYHEDLRSTSPELRRAGDCGNLQIIGLRGRENNEHRRRRELSPGQTSEACHSDNSDRSGPFEREQTGSGMGHRSAVEPTSGAFDSLDSERPGLEGHGGNVREWRGPGWLDPLTARSVAEAGATRGYWGDCDWWYGRDGKYRPIGAGLFPLVAGATGRMGKLRGYGNAICAPQAQAFIEAYMSLER